LLVLVLDFVCTSTPPVELLSKPEEALDFNEDVSFSLKKWRKAKMTGFLLNSST